MGLHPYCIAPEGHVPEPDLRGVGGRPVRSRRVGGLEVWVSESSRPPEVSVEGIRTHDAVIRSATRGPVAPLPVRFGAWSAAEELDASVGSREDEFRRALEELAGTREFGVRILEVGEAEGPAAGTGGDPAADGPGESGGTSKDGGSDSAAGPGRAFLEELARRRAAEKARDGRRDAVVDALGAAVDGLVRDQRVAAPERGPGLASVAHLVERRRVEAYHAAMDDFQRLRSDLRLVRMGPWPPYSFAP